MDNSYSYFYEYYDMYIDEVDFDLWASYIYSLANKKLNDKNILDLGCGTGLLLLSLNNIEQCNLYGVDIDEGMLSMAYNNALEENTHINLFNYDMSKFYLDKKFDFIYCANDSINYLLKEDDIFNLFYNTYKMLNKDSIFTFDIINEDYNPDKEETIEYDNYVFIINRTKENSNLFTNVKIYEKQVLISEFTHKQKLYSIDTIFNIAKKVGYNSVKAYSFLTENEPKNQEDKFQIILKRT